MNDRDRIERELRVNAALVLGMPEGELVVRVEPSTEDGYEATVAAAAAGAAGATEDGAVLRAIGATEKGALWKLLTDTIDRTFGTRVLSPKLEEAMRLLRMTRHDLIEAVRRELTVNPVPPDEPLDPPPPRKPRQKRAKKRAAPGRA